ncbi:hypothetical protein FZC76_16620 [Sutcliffiella horikoshii]|uniref:Uncharacterized protein n=1 Tax=Sutcliffiella horikoshii TaxID=79883 RepID=A0A5D4SUR5_9BACI|nr:MULTISPECIES: hypothetical protein [Bacillaceae]NMH71787.1 hypothetical protein [Bacillus sp. RO2]TYS67147.1 hypothetical protein FZC76_16620 [Sutcliffiella horikoshii]
MTSFNETAIISYVKSRIEEYCKEMETTTPGEIQHDIILGKIEAYNEFLEQFGYDRVACALK